MWLSLRQRAHGRNVALPLLVCVFVASIAIGVGAEGAQVSICGSCDEIEFNEWYHEFSECEQSEDHNGDCDCGGNECHLQTADGRCNPCGHGNCPPPQDDEDLVASLAEGATAACLTAEQLTGLVEHGDTATMTELASLFEGSVLVNRDRRALQVLNCAGNVSIHVPLPDSLFDTLAEATQ